MGWPNKVESISSNLNTTELWVLKEIMNSKKSTYSITDVSSFAGSTEFTVTLHEQEYKFEEHFETIWSVYKI